MGWNMTLNLNLTAGSEDFITITTNLTILPANDPVFQTANVPQQQTVEDGESIIFDISDYVSDPGESTTISSNLQCHMTVCECLEIIR